MILPLPGAERLPATIAYRGETFYRKSELHVTLAGSRRRHDAAALSAAAEGLEFTVKPTKAYRLVRKDARRSLIELVVVEGLDAYSARLGAPRPPAHVTLFTEPGGRGIALYSAAELEALSVPADLELDPGPWRLDEDGAIPGA